jgi:D-inositol-3-phosphate glycosyltransferase
LSSNKIKIAIIEPVGGHGGMNHYDISLCRSLCASNVSPILYTCDLTNNVEDTFEMRRPYVGIFNTDSNWKKGIRFIRGTIAACLHAKFVGCQAVHYHFFNVGILQIFNVIIARALNMRVVITAHDVEAFIEGSTVDLYARVAYRLAHAIIAHNEISRSELKQKFNISYKKIQVIQAGNHLNYAENIVGRTEARKFLNLDNDEYAIVFFGQIKEVKGLDVLIKAIPELLKLNRNGLRVRLIIAGRPWRQTFDKYQKLIDENDLGSLVSLHLRYISDEELPFFYRAADLMVLPYRRIYQSDVALMALTFEAPILTSNVPGMLEMIDHLNTGIIFESENSIDLAEKIQWAIENPDSVNSIVKNGRSLVEKKYSWSLVGRKTSALYYSIS